LRKSGRLSKTPIWLQDYIQPDKGKKTANTCLYPISSILNYRALAPTYQSLVAKLSTEVEPRTYSEAAKDPRWVDAMKAEIQALEDNHTWSIMPLPPGKKAIGCK
ncbi:hypothetical protein A4A49_63957, partial [Nicotiana attenuata]